MLKSVDGPVERSYTQDMTTATATAATAKASDRAASFGLVLPLRYLGAREGRTYQACHGAPVQAAESCDACGQSIMEVHTFVDATGRNFKVGCQCVYKYLPAAHHGAVKAAHAKIAKSERDAKVKARREAAQSRAAILRDDLATLIDERAGHLSAFPHPQPWAAARGETMLDQARWMLANGGAAAHGKMLDTIRAMLLG